MRMETTIAKIIQYLDEQNGEFIEECGGAMSTECADAAGQECQRCKMEHAEHSQRVKGLDVMKESFERETGVAVDKALKISSEKKRRFK